MIRTSLMMDQAAECNWSMWTTDQGCCKLPSCPLQLKPAKMHSPACGYLDAALISNKLRRKKQPKKCHGLGLSSDHRPFFVIILPMGFSGGLRLLVPGVLHSDDVPESLPKYEGWRSFWNSCEHDSLCPAPLLEGCIARRTVNRLSHTTPWVIWRSDWGDLPVPWYKSHLNLTWRAPLQSAAYLSLLILLLGQFFCSSSSSFFLILFFSSFWHQSSGISQTLLFITLLQTSD